MNRRLIAALVVGLSLSIAGPAAAVPGDGSGASGDEVRGAEAVARAFYDAFVSGDAETMERLYHPDVSFRDEIFTFSDRAGTMGMWRVLVSPSGGGTFSYELLSAKGDTATVQWVADYDFPPGRFGRPVHNVITATLTVRDGLIVDHHDAFSWERWSRQAFPLGSLSTWGPIERLLKWTIRTVLGRLVAANEEEAEAAKPAPAPARPGFTDRLRESDD